MPKKPVKEAGTALILATVFFVLTTIAFGVLWYMEFAERDKNKAEVESKAKDVTAARGELADAKLESLVARVFFGVASDDDRKTVNSWSDKEKTKAAEAIKKMKLVLVQAIADGDESKLPAELKTREEGKISLWDLEENGLPGPIPDRSPVALIAEIAKERDAAVANESKTLALYNSALADIKKAVADYEKVKQDFKNITDALPKDFETKLKALADKFEARKEQFTAAEKASRDELDRLKDEITSLDQQKTILGRQIAALTEKVAAQAARIKDLDKSRDTINFGEPHGKILRRLPEGIVEINIGSADLVKLGLTFTVLPSDFPERGRQSRVRIIRQPDSRGEYKNVERFVEKANIEVIEVVGPHLSRARITSEYDPIRDGAAPGDLLYNPIWRKGTADHIALIGIFDINGDGTDDIETVVRDLTRMGVPIDAYFDLKTRKWVGQISNQTRYLVQGALPVRGAFDANGEAKSILNRDVNTAIRSALDTGLTRVSYKDFFPMTGYRVKIDISDERVNLAANPYLIQSSEPRMNPGN
jgi:hypothetical protein